jgi:hypothetical protein
VLSGRLHVLVTEPALHVAQVNTALAELQRDAVTGLVRANVLRPPGRRVQFFCVVDDEIAPEVPRLMPVVAYR